MSSNQPEEWERLIFEQHHFLYTKKIKRRLGKMIQQSSGLCGRHFLAVVFPALI